MATSTLGNGTLVLAGTTSGTTTVTATAVAGTTTLTLPAATDTLVGKATTDTLTNKTLTGAVMNGTLGATTPSTVAATTLTTSSTVTHNGGTANGVAYLDGSKVLTTGSALVFDGTNLGVGANPFGSVRQYIKGTGTTSSTFPLYIDNSAGSNLFTFRDDGKLGIGTTSPQEKLQLEGSGSQYMRVKTTTTNADIYFGITSSSVGYVGTGGSDPLAFHTGNTERARIDSSGNLLVGTTSKFAGGIDGLDLNTTGETGITFGKSGVVKNYFYLITNESAFQWQTVSGVAVNIISSTNGVTLANGGTSWGSLSDERKKDIIEPITDATTKVSGLRAVIGKYKTEEDGIRRAMLIAQDVQAVLPEAVTENADGDLILQYTDTIPLLVAAIKEQTALITTLTARITALESA